MLRTLLVATALAFMLTLAFGHPLSAAPNSSEGDLNANIEIALWRVYFHDTVQLDYLASRLDVWEVHHADGYLVAPLSSEQRTHLQASGYEVEPDGRVLGPPIQAAFSGESLPGYVPNFPCYRTVEKTYADLAALAAQHPDLAAWIDVGDSWNKQHSTTLSGFDIHALVVTNRRIVGPKFRFLLVAAVHAREMVTAEIATRYAERLLAGYGIDPDVTWLLDYGEIHIIPHANPDGRVIAEQGQWWRKNVNNADGCSGENPFFSGYGVDLNRNSDFMWNGCTSGSCSSDNACSPVYRGASPMSEPETQAMQTYARSIFPDQRDDDLTAAAPEDATGLFVSLHSYGGLVLYPWGWSDTPTANEDALRALAVKLAQPLGYSACRPGECLYKTDGTNDDWLYGELGVAAFTIELGRYFFEPCSTFEGAMLEDANEALTIAFKSSRMPYTLAAGPQAELLHLSPARIQPGTPISITASISPGGVSDGFGQSSLGLRYSLDVPSWIEGALTITKTATATAETTTPVAVTAGVDTSEWTLGRHLLIVEGSDDAGRVGLPVAAWVDVVDRALAFELNPALTSGTAEPGKTIAYTLILTNTGVLTDIYMATIVDSGWPLELPDTSVELAAGTNRSLELRVTIPPEARPGDADVAHIRLTSTLDPSIAQIARLETTADPYRYYLPLFNRTPASPRAD